MIFVSVGTNAFDDLVRKMDEIAPGLGQPVICQIGRGSYEPQHCESFRFAPSLDDYIERAKLVVGHGGLGTVMAALRRSRPFVGMSNPSRADQHQEQILGTLEARGHLIWCRDFDQLADCIHLGLTGNLVPYREPACYIPDVIRQYLSGKPALEIVAQYGEART